MCEDEISSENLQIMQQLQKKDLFWVAIGKVHILIEMVIILDNLTRGHVRLNFTDLSQYFIENFIENHFSAIYKFLSLLNREYASHYA